MASQTSFRPNLNLKQRLIGSSQKGICVALSFESSSVPSTHSAGAHQSLAVQLSVLWQDGTQVFEYESIDLNSFGSPLPVGPHRNANTELPLKCAYKDCVAGFRFKVRVKGQTEWSWRRFQLRFESSTDASTFIRLIQDIVPCKYTGTQQSQLPPTTQRQPAQPRQPYPDARPLTSPSHRASTSFPPATQYPAVHLASPARPPSPQAAEPPITSEAILSALYDESLSSSELESLVEEIVAEEGFLPFVDRVRKLWKARITLASAEFSA